MILEIPYVEEIHYRLRFEIDDTLWERITGSRDPYALLGELIDYDEHAQDGGWLADQLAGANCAACSDCAQSSPHAMIGIEERYLDFNMYATAADFHWLLARDQDSPAEPIPHQQEWANEHLGE